MLQSIRAVYKDGQLHPLEPLELEDGQTVNITIDSNEDVALDVMDARLRAAGLLTDVEVYEPIQELSPEERYRIGSRFIGDRSSEAHIDEERSLY